jgi:hypothetical protein
MLAVIMADTCSTNWQLIIHCKEFSSERASDYYFVSIYEFTKGYVN